MSTMHPRTRWGVRQTDKKRVSGTEPEDQSSNDRPYGCGRGRSHDPLRRCCDEADDQKYGGGPISRSSIRGPYFCTRSQNPPSAGGDLGEVSARTPDRPAALSGDGRDCATWAVSAP